MNPVSARQAETHMGPAGPARLQFTTKRKSSDEFIGAGLGSDQARFSGLIDLAPQPVNVSFERVCVHAVTLNSPYTEQEFRSRDRTFSVMKDTKDSCLLVCETDFPITGHINQNAR